MEVEPLLTLLSVPGLGPRRILALVSRFGEPEAVLSASVNELCRTAGVDVKTATAIKSEADREFAREQLRLANRQGVSFVSYWDSRYPERLKQIPDPPVLLYVRGALPGEKEVAVAVVGTRVPSAYGKLVTANLSRDLVREGVTVVSGLARGIDTVAHRAALEAGGKTIAVLGSGLDVIYPSENRALASEIAKSGAVVSEFPLGTQPDATNFPRRNRIISGMSAGTLVVEAGEKSGALITAQLALEQNREVFAVPGNITSDRSRGTNLLIKQGAKLVQNVQDILEELRPQLRGLLREAQSAPRISMSESEKVVYEILSDEPKHIDDIAAELAQPTGTVLATLLSLELKNLALQLTGKYFVRR